MMDVFEMIIEKLESGMKKQHDPAVALCYALMLGIITEMKEEFATDTNIGSKHDCSECSRRKWYQKGYADAEKKFAEGSKNDFCEWEEKKNMFIQNPHTGRKFSNEPSMKNIYCNTCGKKIKVVEPKWR